LPDPEGNCLTERNRGTPFLTRVDPEFPPWRVSGEQDDPMLQRHIAAIGVGDGDRRAVKVRIGSPGCRVAGGPQLDNSTRPPKSYAGGGPRLTYESDVTDAGSVDQSIGAVDSRSGDGRGAAGAHGAPSRCTFGFW